MENPAAAHANFTMNANATATASAKSAASANTPEHLWTAGAMPGKSGRHTQVLFGQVREDARVEMALAATFATPPRVLCIASAGCTALALLAEKTKSVTAIDINPAQVHLVLLKKQIISQLDYLDILNAVCADARPAYAAVRNELSPKTQAFWDSRNRRLARGLARSGIADRLMAGGARVLHIFGHSSSKCRRFLSLNNPDQQREAMRSWWSNRRWRAAFTIGLSRASLRHAFGSEITQRLPADFSNLIRHRFETAMTVTPAAGNPYLWQLLLSRYPEHDSGLPPWLQLDNIATIKERLDHLQVHHADALRHLVGLPDASMEFIALSNILEVTAPEYARQLIEQSARVLADGGMVMLRHILPLSADHIRAMTGSLQYDSDLSAHLKSLERAPFCTEVCVMRLVMKEIT